MVFVPDGAAAEPRPLWDEGGAGDLASELDAAAAARSVASTADTAPSAAAPPSADTAPEWWAPPLGAAYVGAQRREELAQQAKRALRGMEDGKLLRGEDFSLEALVTLRTLCHEGGGLQVRPATESGRDAMLRAAVRFCIALAAEGPVPVQRLGGYEPARFVSGLAHDLGVPDKRAITIAHAEVAASCRSALIDAEAAFRAGDQGGLLRALRRLVAALAAFRLPRGSAEAELVGRGILQHTTLGFRRGAFLTAGAADPSLAPVIAEMLGFDPDLVMPQLEAGQRAAAAEGGGGGTKR